MENKRVTKKEYFEILRGIVEGNDELVAFIDHEVELLSKKSNVRTKAQIENDAIVEDIYNYLAEIGRPAVTFPTIGTLYTFSSVSGRRERLILSAFFRYPFCLSFSR